LITTLGGTIAAVCSRCRSRRNYEFAMHRRHMARTGRFLPSIAALRKVHSSLMLLQ
jgi:hypothetical protein